MKFSGGLRNIPRVENYSVTLTNFHGGTLHVKFSGGVKTFSRRVEKMFRG